MNPHRTVAVWSIAMFTALALHPSDAAEPQRAPETPVQRESLGSLPDGILATSLRISPDGKRIAGVIVRGERWTVLVDGTESPGYEGVVNDSIHFSPDSKHVAYGAKRDGKGIIVVDGKEFSSGLACSSGFPVFSANSAHFLYLVAHPESRLSVGMDGKEGKIWDSIMQGSLTFSPDGEHYVYVAKNGDASRVVLNGVAGPEYEKVGAPAYSPDARHVAYVAVTAKNCVLVVDGRETAASENFVRDSLGFDSQSSVHVLAISMKREITRIQIDLEKLPGGGEP